MELRKLQDDEDLKDNLCFYDALTTSQYTNFVDAVFEVCGPLDIAKTVNFPDQDSMIGQYVAVDGLMWSKVLIEI